MVRVAGSVGIGLGAFLVALPVGAFGLVMWAWNAYLAQSTDCGMGDGMLMLLLLAAAGAVAPVAAACVVAGVGLLIGGIVSQFVPA